MDTVVLCGLAALEELVDAFHLVSDFIVFSLSIILCTRNAHTINAILDRETSIAHGCNPVPPQYEQQTLMVLNPRTMPIVRAPPQVGHGFGA
jgi:hypothetical protein